MISIDKSRFVPAYQQLKDHLKQEIEAGRYLPGDRLPSVRELVKLSELSHLTVVRALNELGKEGHITSESGKGNFVAGETDTARRTLQNLNIAILYSCDVPFPDAFYTPFSYEVVLGINSAATQRDHRLSYESIVEYVKRPDHERADGVIIMNGNNLQAAEFAVAQLHEPAVAVRPVPSFPSISVVDSDELAPTRQAVEHLIELGHKRIAMTTADHGRARNDQHRQAVLQVLAQHKLQPTDDVEIATSIDRKGGEKALAHILEMSEPPTALICGSDAVAVGVIQAARRAGIRVPEDLSIVGKLGFEIFASFHPHITTINVPMRQMGWKALVSLESLISGQAKAPLLEMFTSDFTVRETTAPVLNSSLLAPAVADGR